jgi:hypothetical protein
MELAANRRECWMLFARRSLQAHPACSNGFRIGPGRSDGTGHARRNKFGRVSVGSNGRPSCCASLS